MVKKARYYTNHEFVFSIGQRIKESRKEHNHSQEYHIEKVRLSINSYEDLEKLVSKIRFHKVSSQYFFHTDRAIKYLKPYE